MPKYISIAFLLLILVFGCSEDFNGSDDLTTTPLNTIMALGASRVQGNRPDFEGFRYELWKDLVENNWSIDFIGTQVDDANYPDLDNSSFDRDHEGRGGWTSGQILENIKSWIDKTGAPDIVLFSSPGGNDALQNLSYDDALNNIASIIDILQNANPNITIIIEQMAPGTSSIMVGELKDRFTQAQQDVIRIANDKSTATSTVVAVDMFTGFNDNMLADLVHYNEEGARFIADRYYAVLTQFLRIE